MSGCGTRAGPHSRSRPPATLWRSPRPGRNHKREGDAFRAPDAHWLSGTTVIPMGRGTRGFMGKLRVAARPSGPRSGVRNAGGTQRRPQGFDEAVIVATQASGPLGRIPAIPRELTHQIEMAAASEARSPEATATSQWGLDENDTSRAKARVATTCPGELLETPMPLHIYTVAFLNELGKQSRSK